MCLHNGTILMLTCLLNFLCLKTVKANLEEYLNTPAKIYYKREDTSPTGSHKLNSAIPQAYFAKKEGVERLTTETGAGQWGTALSLACNLLDLDCTVYMVRVSFDQKPDRKNIMNIYNGNVYASPSENTEIGRQILAGFKSSNATSNCHRSGIKNPIGNC